MLRKCTDAPQLLRRPAHEVLRPYFVGTNGRLDLGAIPSLSTPTPAYSNFSLSQGFFTTFRALFSLLAAEEAALQSPLVYPAFGDSQSPYTSTPSQPTDIRVFYAAWLNFATEKDFAWVDQYRVEEGMERRMKRAIEQENKRDRSAARREYNDTVRVSSCLLS